MTNPYFETHLQKNFHTSSDVIRLCCEAPASNIKMWSIHLEKNFHTLSNVIRLHCISIKYWHIQNQWVLSLVEDFPSDIKYYWHKTIKNPWIWEKAKVSEQKYSSTVIDISIPLKWCTKIKYWCKKHPNSLSLELNCGLLNKTPKPWNSDLEIWSVFSDDKVWILRHSKILLRRIFSRLFVKWSISCHKWRVIKRHSQKRDGQWQRFWQPP